MRIHPPEELLGATDFSHDEELRDPIWLIQTVKATAYVMQILDEATASLNKNWGRGRDPGNWALAFLAFAMSESVDVLPWHGGSSQELWREAGFPERPPYGTCYDRFVELEQIWPTFEAAAGRLIQQGKRHDPRVGQHLHIDGCEAETNAAVIHDYINCDACPDWVRVEARAKLASAEAARLAARESRADGRHESVQESRTRRRQRGRALRRRPMAERPARASSEEAKTARQAQNALPVEEAETEREELIEPLGSADGVFRFRGSGGHIFRLGDETAGVRSYSNSEGVPKKYWPGFSNQKVICHFTRAPILVRLFSASLPEYAAYDELLTGSIRQMGGELPEAVVADRGYSYARVFEQNTKLGIASVIDWRASNGSDYRRDSLSHDRHGIPRCRHCKAPTRFVRFSPNDGKPRLWVKCVLGTTEGCKKVQTFSCSTDWKLLLPLWRTDLIYFELKVAHESMEAVHGYWRSRYNVGPANFDTRPKRIGIEWQQLRASAALLIEWTRICSREGWLASARQTQRLRHCAERKALRRAYRFPELGQEALDSLLASRRSTGLTEPYGPQAVELYGETANALPPSERPGARRRGSELARRRRANAARRRNGGGRGGGEPRSRGSG